MDFQNNNGTATKEEAAKEVTSNAANGAGKTNHTITKDANGNGRSESKKEKTPSANQAGAHAKDEQQAEKFGESLPAGETGLPAGEAGKGEDTKTKSAGKAHGDNAEFSTDKHESDKQQSNKEASQLPGRQANAKAELTLDAKIKAVNDLHRKTIQRLALIARIKTLEEFEVKLVEENDELESNPYHGCKLIIEDDKRRQFVTNTPGLIRMVSEFIFDACESKLAEIESTINFPQA